MFCFIKKFKVNHKVSIKSGAGFTMVELIVTIFIVSFGMILISSAFANMVSTMATISSRFTAMYLAKEGMEIVRNIRDNNFVNGRPWDRGLKACSKGCQADYKTNSTGEGLRKYNDSAFLSLNADGFYSYNSGVATTFKRKITFQEESKSVAKVTVEVFWSSRGSHHIKTKGYLYDWY